MHNKLPQHYSLNERIRIIKKGISEGKSFNEIGEMFNVTGGAIKYHYERYVLKITHRPNRPTQIDPLIEYLKELAKADLL